jgi:DNA replication protein DnaC
MSADSNFLKSMGVDVDSLNKKALALRQQSGKGCIECDYNGYTLNSNGKTIVCSCIKYKMLKEIYEVAGIPRRYWTKTLDDWNIKQDANGNFLGRQQEISFYIKALTGFYSENVGKIAKGYDLYLTHTNNVKSKLHSLMFTGKNGSGKTFISAMIAKEAIDHGLRVKFYDWSELVNTIGFYENLDEIDAIKQVFLDYEIVVIDGVEIYNHLPPFFHQSLDRICKARLNSGFPIIITTNGTQDQISTCSGWNSLIQCCLNVNLPEIMR